MLTPLRKNVRWGILCSGLHFFLPFSLFLISLLVLLETVSARANSDVIGRLFHYSVLPGETLHDIARRFELGYIDIIAANPGIDPWLPPSGQTLILPTAHVLPDAPREGLVVNLAEQRLYFFPRSDHADTVAVVQTYPLGIGRDGLETPIGQTKVRGKVKHPSWYPTKRMRQEDPDLPAVVPPGLENPLGEYALYLAWPSYLIHGTNKPWGVGRRVSSGCIRLYPEGIERLYRQVRPNEQVTIVDQPLKLGWVGDELFLEASVSQAQADIVEREGTIPPEDVPDFMPYLLAVGESAEDRIDWTLVERVLRERSGVPTRITIPSSTLINVAHMPSASRQGEPTSPGPIPSDILEHDFLMRAAISSRSAPSPIGESFELKSSISSPVELLPADDKVSRPEAGVPQSSSQSSGVLLEAAPVPPETHNAQSNAPRSLES